MNRNEFYDNEFSPYFFMSRDGSSMIAVYVDDCLLAAKTEGKLKQGFDIKFIGDITGFHRN